MCHVNEGSLGTPMGALTKWIPGQEAYNYIVQETWLLIKLNVTLFSKEKGSLIG